MGLKINAFAQRRMEKFGITRDQVEYMVQHYRASYGSDSTLDYHGQLPDGRRVKIKTDSENNVLEVYTRGVPEERG